MWLARHAVGWPLMDPTLFPFFVVIVHWPVVGTCSRPAGRPEFIREACFKVDPIVRVAVWGKVDGPFSPSAAPRVGYPPMEVMIPAGG